MGEPGEILSHNMYAYTANNPVMRVDPSGYSWKGFWKGVGDFFEDVKDTVIDNVGASVNVGKEKTTSFNYYWLCETETGLGYSKSFDNGKPINFFANAPDNWWQFWEYSVGVDVNVNGKGAGINIGGENSINLHLGDQSLDISSNLIGRIGFKSSVSNNDGTYSYSKFSLNTPEIGVTAAVIYFAWPYLISGGPGLIPA